MSPNNPFLLQPTTPEMLGLMQHNSETLAAHWDWVVANLPPSAERTLAQRKLQEFRMWFNAALVLNPSENNHAQ